MNQYLEALIAMMISLIPPGYSMYSQVPIAHCDEKCQQTKVCDDPSKWSCRTPELSQGRLYELATDYARTNGVSYEEAVEHAKPYSYTRTETYEEGLARYYVIAKAARDVSLKMNNGYCKEQCKQFTEEDDVITCHKACGKSSPWKWDRKSLEYLMLTVAQYESGFRADIHGGLPPLGRGDCSWEKDGKKVPAWTKGGHPIMSTCRSICLGQINLGDTGTVRYDGQVWKKDDLAGVDYASTERCFTAVAQTLTRGRYYCTGPVAPRYTDWAAVTLSLYGSGNSCQNKKLMARSNTFWRTFRHPKALSTKAKGAIQEPEVQALIQRLLGSQKQVFWMLPLPTPAKPTLSEGEDDEKIALNGDSCPSGSIRLLSTCTPVASP